ncbi:hypothetical protein L208DRAFT_1393471 [Tricholoma matsutake]|nr:hypothetical protein L208DRAFT_1393471 [Tricholoma matsutake 945]
MPKSKVETRTPEASQFLKGFQVCELKNYIPQYSPSILAVISIGTMMIPVGKDISAGNIIDRANTVYIDITSVN